MNILFNYNEIKQMTNSIETFRYVYFKLFVHRNYKISLPFTPTYFYV